MSFFVALANVNGRWGSDAVETKSGLARFQLGLAFRLVLDYK
jgi:hypothetical protein